MGISREETGSLDESLIYKEWSVCVFSTGYLRNPAREAIGTRHLFSALITHIIRKLLGKLFLDSGSISMLDIYAG